MLFGRLRRNNPELVVLAGVLVLALAGVVTLRGGPAAACPPGTERARDAERLEAEAGGRYRTDLAPQYRGGVTVDLAAFGDACIPIDRWETFADLAMRDAELSAMHTAPFAAVAPGAARAATEQRAALAREPAEVAGAAGTWAQYDRGPILFDDERYSDGTGIVNSTGRIDDFKYDAATNRLFAAIGTGGVWLSEDRGESWRPLTDHLATNVISSLAYTPAGGPDGTLVVLTGEHTYGGGSYLGIGAWYSRDLGATWTRSEGLLDNTFGFAMEADPSDPNVIYAATGKGLWRSTDAGETFVDVVLPTGDCAGDYNLQTCIYANMVTDVVVQHPGGSGDTEGGTVVAAVGWRAGEGPNPEEFNQSPNNGIYRSDTGAPGTFERLDGLDSAAGGKERLGRIELGPATGEEQNHDYLYAIVEDAVFFNGGYISPIDEHPAGANPTVFNGIYVSSNFGASWTQLANAQELSDSCPVNESVYCIPGVIEPGAQAWYNLWVLPDPTKQVGGIPTRLLFGLEEVWENRETQLPTNTPATSFHVIGRYYGGADCLLVATDCGVNREAGVTTTHPDQHAAIILPTVDEEGAPDGGAELFVGNDGGIYNQTADQVTDFTQFNWDTSQDNGLQTLLPYSAVIANDGIAYAGLQDNGHVKVDPTEEHAVYETYGADGTFAAVDPKNSDYVWESVQGGVMNVSSDGGSTWTAATPPASNKRFVNPFAMDPLDTDHLVTGGRQINETLLGPATVGGSWISVFDLGTSTAPQPDGVAAPPNQQTALDVRGDGVYVGFCGTCDILNSPSPFQNGIATNVAGPDLPEKGTEQGWHFAKAEGLPNRYITSIAIDPYDASQRTVYVSLGGYSRRWVPPGSLNDDNANVGEGHLYKSTDAGETFVDISGDLPDAPVLWVEPRGSQLLLATENAVYITEDTDGGAVAELGGGQLPSSPVTSLQLKADDPGFLLAGSYGRGFWTYQFPDREFASRRLQGPTRVETSVEVSAQNYASADTVVIARSDVYADALAGSPLAYQEDAPLLLTPSAGLGSVVADEIERLGATRAILLGGEAALSAQVEADLSAIGVTDTERYDGVNRFDTARLIAVELDDPNVYVVEGGDADPARGWPDAMSIAPVAAAQGRPILLVETDRLPAETTQAIEQLDASTGRVVGGPVAVSEALEDQLAQTLHLTARIAGANRFATSVAAAEVGQLEAGLEVQRLWLARGGQFADALTAGPTVARDRGVLLLVNDTNLDDSAASRDFIAASACTVDVLTFLGGPVAISERVERQVRAFFNGCPSTDLPAPPKPKPTVGPAPPPAPPREVLVGPFGWEADAEGWTVAIEDGANPQTEWTRGGPGHESDTSFAVAPYGPISSTTLTSPELQAPDGTVFLTWWARFDIEGGGFDEVSVEWSEDGEAWLEANLLGGQNNGWPDDFNSYEASFDPEGDTFLVRFRFYSDQFCSSIDSVPNCDTTFEGFWLDDVAVEGTAG